MHIGSPKCASSTLQQNIFSTYKQINYLYLGKYPDYKNRSVKNIFDYISGRSRKNFKESDVGNILKFDKDIYLFSWEGLTAPLHILGESNLELIPERAEELNNYFDVRIILLVRNQINVIPSFFLEFFYQIKKKYKINSVKEFVDFRFEDKIFWKTFKYNYVAKQWERHFQNVNLLQIENPKSIYVYFSRYLKIDYDWFLVAFDKKKNVKSMNSQDYYSYSLYRVLLFIKKKIYFKNMGLAKYKIVKFLINQAKNVNIYKSKTQKDLKNYNHEIIEYYRLDNQCLLEKYRIDYSENS